VITTISESKFSGEKVKHSKQDKKSKMQTETDTVKTHKKKMQIMEKGIARRQTKREKCVIMKQKTLQNSGGYMAHFTALLSFFFPSSSKFSSFLYSQCVSTHAHTTNSLLKEFFWKKHFNSVLV